MNGGIGAGDGDIILANLRGKVGIGTSAPGQLLTVSGGTIQIVNGSQ